MFNHSEGRATCSVQRATCSLTGIDQWRLRHCVDILDGDSPCTCLQIIVRCICFHQLLLPFSSPNILVWNNVDNCIDGLQQTYSLSELLAYSLWLYRYNHLQGNDASKIRVNDFISFLTCKKPGLFCFFAQVVGTPGHTS